MKIRSGLVSNSSSSSFVISKDQMSEHQSMLFRQWLEKKYADSVIEMKYFFKSNDKEFEHEDWADIRKYLTDRGIPFEMRENFFGPEEDDYEA